MEIDGDKKCTLFDFMQYIVKCSVLSNFNFFWRLKHVTCKTDNSLACFLYFLGVCQHAKHAIYFKWKQGFAAKLYQALSKSYPRCFQNSPTFYWQALKWMNAGWHAKIKKLKNIFLKDAFCHASCHSFVIMPIDKKKGCFRNSMDSSSS